MTATINSANSSYRNIQWARCPARIKAPNRMQTVRKPPGASKRKKAGEPGFKSPRARQRSQAKSPLQQRLLTIAVSSHRLERCSQVRARYWSL